MGFRKDGSAVIGKPGLSISANLGYQGSDSSGYFTDIIRTVAGINKARVSTGGIYLYTYDFTTGTPPAIPRPAWTCCAPSWTAPSPSAAP